MCFCPAIQQQKEKKLYMGRQFAQAIEQPATFFGLILDDIIRLDVMITELKFKYFLIYFPC